MLIITCVILTYVYAALILAYSIGWNRQKDFILPVEYTPTTFASIIIPARNEAKNIGACLDSIIAQKYPLGLMEIIVVDDHSDDNTAEIVKEYAHENVVLVSLADEMESGKKVNAYKKAALARGIAHSQGTLIVTTDADCTAPNAWLLHLVAHYELEQADMVVAPAMFSTNHSIVQMFQQIDFMSMQGITVAARQLKLGNMCNGANLAFTRAAYDEVNGYEGGDRLASGDDYLLMTKISKMGASKIVYLKSPKAVMLTAPQPDWAGFFQQRIRWASKSGKYSDMRLTLILLLVYLFNVSFLVMVLAGFGDETCWYVILGMLLTKTIVEYIYLRPVAHFFRNEWVMKYHPLLQPLHIAYIISAGFLGLIGGYKWKGRKVR